MTSLPIELPEGFLTIVTEGDTVTPGQVLAQKEAPKDEIVNILEGLNITRDKVKKTLKKNPGDTVSPGDIVAVKTNLFGKPQATIISQIAGTVLRYERDTGNLVVRSDIEPASLEIISPVAGKVSLCNNKEIVIDTDGVLVADGVAVGTNGEGVLFVLKESFDDTSPDAVNTLYFLDGQAEGKIVLVKTLTRDLIIKGDSLGAAGFLSNIVSDEDIEYVKEKEINLPVLSVNDELVTQLHSWENKKIMLDIISKSIILRE